MAPIQYDLCSSCRMNGSLIISLILLLIAAIASQEIPHNYYDKWMVVAQNSSGQLFFDVTPLAPRIFIWKPYNVWSPPVVLL